MGASLCACILLFHFSLTKGLDPDSDIADDYTGKFHAFYGKRTCSSVHIHFTKSKSPVTELAVSASLMEVYKIRSIPPRRHMTQDVTHYSGDNELAPLSISSSRLNHSSIIPQADSLFLYQRTANLDPLTSGHVIALFNLSPVSGPREGGTDITIRGSGFFHTGRELCRFSCLYAGVDCGSVMVPAQVVTNTKAYCTSPFNRFAGTTYISLSMDGTTYSADFFSALHPSGTLLFTYRSTRPSGQFTMDNNTGPFSGGTVITITIDQPHENNDDGIDVSGYSRFEPSSLNSCLFKFSFTTSVRNSISLYTEAKWLTYRRIQCASPPCVSHSYETVLATLFVSNDGLQYSKEIGNFTYRNTVPKLFKISTMQEAGAYVARGPWSGNTEVYVIGNDFLPSEKLKARFVAVVKDLSENFTGVLEKKEGECLFDTAERVRCISPPWYPSDSLMIQSGDLQPCFLTSVHLSNDDGKHWSADISDKFLYCPVYVSTYGSNSLGEGTPRLPFRDLNRAVQAILANPWKRRKKFRSSVQNTSCLGSQRFGGQPHCQNTFHYINSDQILLTDGIYQDTADMSGAGWNLNLAAHGRVIEVLAQNAGRVFLDCTNKNIEVLHATYEINGHEPDVEQRGSISFKDVGIVRCTGFIRWELFDYHWRVTQSLNIMPFLSSELLSRVSVCKFEPFLYGLPVIWGHTDETGPIYIPERNHLRKVPDETSPFSGLIYLCRTLGSSALLNPGTPPAQGNSIEASLQTSIKAHYPFDRRQLLSEEPFVLYAAKKCRNLLLGSGSGCVHEHLEYVLYKKTVQRNVQIRPSYLQRKPIGSDQTSKKSFVTRELEEHSFVIGKSLLLFRASRNHKEYQLQNIVLPKKHRIRAKRQLFQGSRGGSFPVD